MRIDFLTQFFPPESGACPNRLGDLSRRLAACGHDVTVITALPSYPLGRFYDGYGNRVFLQERWNGVRVIRTWLYPVKSKRIFPRLFNYLSFLPLSFLAGLTRVRRGDVVIVNSPPLFLGLIGLLICSLKRARFVLNVSDLWPESGVALGLLKNRTIVRLATELEELLYRHAWLITGQTRGIVASIRPRCENVPVLLLTNGVAPEFMAQVDAGAAKRSGTRAEFGWEDKFVVGYAGLHGLSSGLEIVLQAAAQVDGSGNEIFALFGDGPEKNRIQQKAKQMGLRNIQFHDQQDASRIAEIMPALDASLVPLRGYNLFRGALPSKLFEAMGAGLPVIAAVEGESQDVVEKSGGGIRIEPENAQQLVAAIRLLRENPLLRASMGAAGREYALRHFNRQDIALNFHRVLVEMEGVSREAGWTKVPRASKTNPTTGQAD